MMEFNMEKAQGLLDREIEEAKQVIQNPSKVDEILVQLEEKLKEVPKIGETLSEVPLMIAMVKAWITKDYPEVSPKVIACLVGAVIYLIKKKDLIADNIPIIGMVDDLGVMALALKLCEPELKAFAEWRVATDTAQV
jgi:uncharacterized membrane protein YkvA (DUF1232 family)